MEIKIEAELGCLRGEEIKGSFGPGRGWRKRRHNGGISYPSKVIRGWVPKLSK
jgi:hypothetical protein